MDQQMLPCQQAMMLDEALAFEKLILSEKKGKTTTNMVSWNNPKHLQEFIEKLQAAAERLTLHNRLVTTIYLFLFILLSDFFLIFSSVRTIVSL